MNGARDRIAAALLVAVADLEDLQAEALASTHPVWVKWLKVFGEDIDVCQRARNNIRYGDFLSDSNLNAALQIANRLIVMGNQAKEKADAT